MMLDTKDLGLVVSDKIIWAVTRDFQQCGILTSVDSYEYVRPHFQLRNLK